jgi:hypothetical protein
MEDKIQLCTSSQENEKKYDEVDLWRESYKENVRFAQAKEMGIETSKQCQQKMM